MKSGSAKPDYSLILMLAAIFVFHSPFAQWWSRLNLPWYSIFIFWLVFILLVALNHLRESPHGGD